MVVACAMRAKNNSIQTASEMKAVIAFREYSLFRHARLPRIYSASHPLVETCAFLTSSLLQYMSLGRFS